MNRAIWIAISLILAGALYLSWDTAEMADPEVGRSKKKERPVVLRDPVFSNYDDGSLTWRMSAEKAEVFDTEKRSLLFSTEGTLYSKKEPKRTEITIFADHCLLAKSGGTSEFRNNVRVHFADGKRLYTERLFVDHKRETIYNRQATRIEGLNGQIEASSFAYDIRLKSMRFESPKVRIDLE